MKLKYSDLKAVQKISVIIFWFSVAILPFACMALVFGLAGSVPQFAQITGVGYFGLIIFSFVTKFKQYFFVGVIISVLTISTGLYLDADFWKKENRRFCEDLRANPSCTEDETGFSCSDYHGGRLHTSKKICE